jgi:hypothetical protein
MKPAIYPALIPLMLGTFLLASCKKDKETQFVEDKISILESVVDEESADDAALELIDVDLKKAKYEKDNFRTEVNYRKLIKTAHEKNYYNSEKLREALQG